MYLLYTDEANINPVEENFFIYGGVSIPGEEAGPLSERICTIRADLGYKPTDLLKFNTTQRPEHISPEDHREAKRQLILAAAKHGVRLFASFVLHKIATSPDEARRNEINRIVYHFDCFLARENDYGLVLLDRFDDSLGPVAAHLREKSAIGLVGMPFSDTMKLPRILGYHMVSIGTSHFCSLVDVVIGSLRYAVNNRQKTGKQQDVARVLIGQLAPLCVQNPYGGVDRISISFSPLTITTPAYLEMYKDLHCFLADGGIEARQQPSNVRVWSTGMIVR